MASQDDDQSTSVYVDYNWIAANGGWIHSNNVLFYFAQSPFFDRTSANQTIITQNSGIPEREEIALSTRQRFESQLDLITGLQYVVVHDPLESKTVVQGSGGPEPSDVWVIRKQVRFEKGNKDQNVHMLGFYYIIRQVIYEAPSIANVLSYRMLNATLSLDKVFTTAATMPLFSASHGHTYIRPEQKSAISTSARPVQNSRDHTPALDNVNTATQKTGESKPAGTTTSDMRTLRDALNMTLRHGKEYSNEMPLIGEPGSFRYARAKDAAPKLLSTTKGSDIASKPMPASKVGTPVPVTSSSPPTLRTDVAPDNSQKASAKSPSQSNPAKPKRRKSRIGSDAD